MTIPDTLRVFWGDQMIFQSHQTTVYFICGIWRKPFGCQLLIIDLPAVGFQIIQNEGTVILLKEGGIILIAYCFRIRERRYLLGSMYREK